jgi:hypothetical protein
MAQENDAAMEIGVWGYVDATMEIQELDHSLECRDRVEDFQSCAAALAISSSTGLLMPL